MSPVRRDAATC